MLTLLARLSSSSRTVHQRRLIRCRSHRQLTSSTYYDSQSGMNVPLHDEDSVKLYMYNKCSRGPWRVGEQFDIEAGLESLLEMHAAGVAGFRLPIGLGPSAVSLAESLAPSAEDFTLFLPSARKPAVEYPGNVNLLFEYTDSRESVAKDISRHLMNGTNTSIGLFDMCYFEREPIEVASGVASLIDEGGCNFVWLCPNGEISDGENMVELVEQLSYLDVAGPTIKSRLVVDPDMFEECLDLGVNKFVVQDLSRLEFFRGVIEGKGKRLESGKGRLTF